MVKLRRGNGRQLNIGEYLTCEPKIGWKRQKGYVIGHFGHKHAANYTTVPSFESAAETSPLHFSEDSHSHQQTKQPKQ